LVGVLHLQDARIGKLGQIRETGNPNSNLEDDMRIWYLPIACLALLVGCGVAPTVAADRQPDVAPKARFKSVAAGLNGDCPRASPECEIFLTIVDNPDTSPSQGGQGKCEVAVPVSEIRLHSNPQTKQVVRWKILNSNDFGFTQSAVVISPNKVPNGDPAFENGKFSVAGKDDQYQWQSTGKQTASVDNGYTAYVYRKTGNLACGTKDPLIVNLP